MRPHEPQTKKKKRRKKEIIWFNPPFSRNVKTNIGKEFLKLLDKSFPVGNPLRSVFNRNTVKIGYKCMPNMAVAISRHNSRILNQDTQLRNKEVCKCEGGPKTVQLGDSAKKNGLFTQPKLQRVVLASQKHILD